MVGSIFDFFCIVNRKGTAKNVYTKEARKQ